MAKAKKTADEKPATAVKKAAPKKAAVKKPVPVKKDSKKKKRRGTNKEQPGAGGSSIAKGFVPQGSIPLAKDESAYADIKGLG